MENRNQWGGSVRRYIGAAHRGTGRGHTLKQQEALHIQGKECIWEDVGLQCELSSIAVSTRLDDVDFKFRSIPSSRSGFREKPLYACMSYDG